MYKKSFSKNSSKKTFNKKVYKKKMYNKKKSLVSLIKKVSLSKTETKHAHVSSENININHNTGYIVTSLLNLGQGYTEPGNTTTSLAIRIADEVVARGISIKLWIANKLDRPNIMYRVVVFKYQSQSIPALSQLFKGGIGNKIMDDIDVESYTPVYQKIFNLQVGYSAYATGTAGDTDGREAHKYLSIWVPLKDKKIVYNDGGQLPKFTNYGFFIVPYDSFGTLITDNIASFTYIYKYYFKDP